MSLKEWVALPSRWIEDGGLKSFRWVDNGAANTAALMALIAVAHNIDRETASCRMTYDEICLATGISRASLSAGLSLLESRGIIRRWGNGRSTYQLLNFDMTAGWCKLPAKKLYIGNEIAAFREFRLRSKTELYALKLYLLFASRRDNEFNVARISYDKITEYTGTPRPAIKSAISFLASLSMIYVEHLPSNANEYGISNAYRLNGISDRTHMGNVGRRLASESIAHEL